MSDTNISAPPPAAAPSPAPAPSQGVAIDPNPTAPPQPIGSQAPPLNNRDASREQIRKAFAKAERPGPAKAGMGHNQPPEPMQKEKTPPPKGPPLDLKKRPSDQQMPRERGEHGHFARAGDAAANAGGRSRGQQAGTVRQPQGQPAPTTPYKVTRLPDGAPYRSPPKRFDQRARAEWGAAPESVRANVARMHHEFSKAYRAMHGDHQEMSRIRHFQQMAQQHGTTLERALSNYTGMEQKLRTDPVGGLDVIVNNLNLRTSDGQRLGLRDIAWHVLNQSPDQHQSLQLKNSQGALAQQLAQIQQAQRALAQQQAHMQYQQKFAHMRRGVDRFAESHPRLDELGDLIQKELRLGFNLPAAYRRAELLRPAGSSTHAAQTRTAPAQTRSADRSIHGAPSSPSNRSGQGKRAKPSANPREAVTNALRRMNGSP